MCGKCKTPLPERRAAPSTVTDATFSSEVENSATPVLLDLWADWCGPCHMLAPTIDQLSSEMAGRVKVAKLNIDENPGTANRFGVRSIPTLLVLKGGKEVDRLVGVQPKQEIRRTAGERSEELSRSAELLTDSRILRPLLDQRLLRSLRCGVGARVGRRLCALSSSADPMVFPST